jgi:hypothetical protein
MKTKIEIGLKVNSSKYGEGPITRIITKSTGYVEVNFNGNIRKEMGFNLTVNGIELKSKPVNKTNEERIREKLIITSNIPASWINADGTKNHKAYNDFLEEREKAKWNSKSF